jgi:hypothetical protein
MTLPGNGTAKRIIAGIVVAVVVFLAGAVLSNSNRITAVESKIQAIVDIQSENRKTLETNRTENRDEHKAIIAELKEISKEVRK